MLFKQTLAVATISACLGGVALADTLNLASTPGSDTFTTTSITFVNPGSAGPVSGSYFAGLACGSCTTWSPLTMTSGGGTEMVTIVSGGLTDVIDFTSYTFSGTDHDLTITGTGTSQINGGILQGISFSLTTQLASGTAAGTPTSYSGSVQTTPLPPAWTMLFASLLGLGFMTYRGSKKQSSAFSMA